MPSQLSQPLQPTLPSALIQAGQAANRAAARHRFEDYRSRRAAETLRRQEADLGLFADFLGEMDIPIGDLLIDPEAWRGITWGLVEAFVKWQLQKGYAVPSVNVRALDSQDLCPAGIPGRCGQPNGICPHPRRAGLQPARAPAGGPQAGTDAHRTKKSCAGQDQPRTGASPQEPAQSSPGSAGCLAAVPAARPRSAGGRSWPPCAWRTWTWRPACYVSIAPRWEKSRCIASRRMRCVPRLPIPNTAIYQPADRCCAAALRMITGKAGNDRTRHHATGACVG